MIFLLLTPFFSVTNLFAIWALAFSAPAAGPYGQTLATEAAIASARAACAALDAAFGFPVTPLIGIILGFSL